MNQNPPESGNRWIDIGSEVIDRHGETAGKVAYVVVQPPEYHLTDIVVNTGSFLGRDVVVPASDIDHLADGQVYLTIDKAAIAELPDYVEVHYEAPPENWAPAPSLYYPAQAVLWPTGTAYPEVSSVKVNTPTGTIGLHGGMTVETSDGHKLGEIESLDEDASGDLSDIIIKQGFLFPHDTVIPVSSIGEIRDDKVVLNVTKDDVHHRLADKSATGFRAL